jgi:large subunit ribosomal protein L21
MYAVIKTGGKQHKVSLGDRLEIEKLDLSVGDEVVFDQVMAFQDKKEDSNNPALKIGTPFLEGAKVLAEVTKQDKQPKIKIFKFRRRKHSAKSQGHRQLFTEVEIKSLNL